MPLVNSKKMLAKAKKEKRAVGAFNVLSLEMIQAVIKAAEKENTPVILQVSTGAMNWAKFEYISPMILSAAINSKVDIAVHLDHSQDLNLIKKSIDFGYTSVMYDGSHFSVEKNIKESLIAKKYCNKNTQLELEIGKVGGKEDDLISDTNELVVFEDVIDFYEKTKSDSLAIAFGTAHGMYKGKINLDFDLIEKVSKVIPVPLVMHGTSGIPFELIKKSIKSGITKVNVGTDLLIAYNKSMREYFDKYPYIYDIRKINTYAMEAIEKKVVEYIKLFNSL